MNRQKQVVNQVFLYGVGASFLLTIVCVNYYYNRVVAKRKKQSEKTEEQQRKENLKKWLEEDTDSDVQPDSSVRKELD